MFTVIKTVLFVDPQTGIKVLARYPLENLLTKGLLMTENLVLRNCVGCRIAELLFPQEKFSNELLQ